MRLLIALLTLTAILLGLVHQASYADSSRSDGPQYRVIESIPGPDGTFDHLSIDARAGQLYLARGDGVMKLDLFTGDITPAFVKGEHVNDVIVLPGGRLLSTNEGTNTAVISEQSNGARIFRIPTGDGPDIAVYDTFSKLAYVMDSNAGTVTVIDPAAGKLLSDISVGGKLEFAVSDGAGHIYINVTDRAQVAVLDTKSRKVVGYYALPGCSQPTGLGIDPSENILVSACRNRKAVALRAKTGSFMTSFDIDKIPDDVIFDAKRKHFVIPCALEGTLFSIPETSTGLGIADRTTTAIGARTGALDTRTGWLYLPAADYTIGLTGFKQKDGTFRILLMTMK